MTIDPMKRKILYMMMENGGISPDDIFDTPKKGVNEVAGQQMGGGGVSTPALGMQIPGPMEERK